MHHMVLDSFDPLPDRRIDYFMAQVSMMLGNRWRDPKAPAFTLDDFLLFSEHARAPRSTEEVEADLHLIFG